MDKVSIVRYSPADQNHLLTGELVECYREVFADRPWGEWLKCSVCSKYWGSEDRAEITQNGFRHCGVPLVDFWPREQVLTDIIHEITPQASCWLAVDFYQRVVGFCWGYPIAADELQNKLGIPMIEKLGDASNKPIAYQDEVGVILPKRGQKIAKHLISQRLDDFISQGLEISVVRTRQAPEPSVTFRWYTQKLGYDVIAQYPNGDGRVILARKISGLKNLLTE